VRNVLALKAYCVAEHDKLLAMKKSSQLSALGSFLYSFGDNSKKLKVNAVGEYVSMYRSYNKFYKTGLGKYLLSRLHSALLKSGGILTAQLTTVKHWGRISSVPAMVLKHRALGLSALPSMFTKLALPVPAFTKALQKVRKSNKITVASTQFQADGCKCQVPRNLVRKKAFHNMGSTCRKWFAYDKKPWCFVNKGCSGAIKTRGGLFKYC